MNEAYARALETPSVASVSHKDEKQPRTIVGRVIDSYTTASDYNDEPVPVVLLDDNDNATEWIVKGYATSLAGQLERLQPHIGDLLGVGYSGRADEEDVKSAHRVRGPRLRALKFTGRRGEHYRRAAAAPRRGHSTGRRQHSDRSTSSPVDLTSTSHKITERSRG